MNRKGAEIAVWKSEKEVEAIKHKYPKSTSKRAVEFFENALEDFLAESTPSFPIGQVWERRK